MSFRIVLNVDNYDARILTFFNGKDEAEARKKAIEYYEDLYKSTVNIISIKRERELEQLS